MTFDRIYAATLLVLVVLSVYHCERAPGAPPEKPQVAWGLPS